jgi:hypothetical protein
MDDNTSDFKRGIIDSALSKKICVTLIDIIVIACMLRLLAVVGLNTINNMPAFWRNKK